MQSYNPPTHLLSKMNETVPKGTEILSYIMEGGEAGGYHRWLALLVRNLKLKNILELGNREGASTILLYSELLSDGTLITVDNVHDQRFIPDVMWKDPKVRFVFGDCLDLNSYQGNLPKNIDLLFLDTIHTYEQVSDEFSIYENFLSDDALIVIDDIHLNDKGIFFDNSPYEKFDLTSICHVSGFGLIHYVRKNKMNEDQLNFKAALASASIWKRKADYLEATQLSNMPQKKGVNPIRKFIWRFRPIYHPVRVWLKSKTLPKV